ncbi:phage tail tape measure protein [Lacticaseibacillus mingshuiensis]|uniref:phage tail tape measure protein n=1 Tax=Lacticaseibacillus mingshuiensis TaxID=2799574 RepID=UPI0019501208|nr:phage tail tape measure protein [Lacticaseibacillus mingshuiensis]
MSGNLGHIASTISLNIDPFQASAKALGSTIKATQAELKALDATSKGNETTVNGMKASYEATARQMKNYEAQLARQKATYDKLSGATAKTDKEQQTLNARTANAASAYNKTSAQIEALRNKMNTLNKSVLLQQSGWTKAGEGLEKFSTLSGKLGTGLSNVGSKLTMGVTAPIVAGLGTAVKSAISFSSQIDAIGPLLTNGAAVTKKYRDSLDQMSASSLKWAGQYGISTDEINDALSEMVKRGFSANQVLGSMPSILDATVASGEPLEDVMQATASIMEQFGLKSNTTAGQLKNTQAVTDELTYAANATAAGFGDMSLAMSYVGPVAKSVGMSVSDTAAAVGELSNQGIEGQKAGTNLRGILTALINPSGAVAQKIKSLGMDAGYLKKNAGDLPKIIEYFTASLAGMTKQQKASALAAIFGRQNQAAFSAMMAAGTTTLRNLTKETENSAGATKKVADQLNDTQANKVKRFQQSIKALGISFGQQLLPTLAPIVDDATKLIQKFSAMDAQTQKSIIKWALLAAAAGPVAGALGKVMKVTSGVTGGLAKTALGIGRAVTAAKAGGTGVEVLKSAFSKTALEAVKAGGAMETAAGGGTSLVASLAPAVPVVSALAVAVGAGIAVWELWGKEAVASAQRTQKWGSDIGASASKAAGSMQQASGQISGALDNTNQSTQTNAKQIAAGFDAMTKAAQKASDESAKAAKKLAATLGGDSADQLLAATAKEEAADKKRIAQLQSNAAKAKAITAAAAKGQEALTADQLQIIKNLQQDSATEAVKSLSLGGKAENNVIKAVLGQRTNMTKEQAAEQLQEVHTAQMQEIKEYGNKQREINDNDQLTTKQRNAALAGLENDLQSKLKSIRLGAIQAMKQQGMSQDEIIKNLYDNFGVYNGAAEDLLTEYQQNMSKTVVSNKQFAASITNDMDAATKKAGNDWNKLVLDPKTGKVKTNLDEVLTKTASTKKGWAALEFDLKNAKITSNAKQTIVEAMAASKQWKTMPDWEKNAVIRMQGRSELADVMEKFKSWNKLTLKEQRAIVNGDYTALADSLIKAGDWNKMTIDEKQAVVNDKATPPLIDSLIQGKKWNSLTWTEKKAIVDAKGAADVGLLYLKYGQFAKLDDTTKKAVLKDEGFLKQVANDSIKYHNFATLPDSIKKALMNDKDLRQKLIDSGQLVDDFNKNHNPTEKKPTADTGIFNHKMLKATDNTNKFKKQDVGKTKMPTAVDHASPDINRATKAAKAWQGQGMGSTKTAKGKDNASGALTAAKKSWTAFGGNETITKKFNFVANISDKIRKLLHLKNGTTNFAGGLAMVNDAPGRTYREAIIHKATNTVSYFEDRNVITPLAKGDAVVPAAKAAAFYNIPQFANGTPNYSATINEINAMQMTTGNSTPTVNVAATDNSAVVAGLSTLAILLKQLLDKDIDIYMDKKRVAAVINPELVKINQRNKSVKRRGMGII